MAAILAPYKGALAVVAGAISSKFFNELVQDKSWQQTFAILAGIAVSRAVYNFLSEVEEKNHNNTIEEEGEETKVVASSVKQQQKEEKYLATVDESRCNEEEEEEKKEERHNELPNSNNKNEEFYATAQSLAENYNRDCNDDHDGDQQAGAGASVATAPAGYTPESLAGEEPITRAQILAQQENIESDKILFLRKEVAKLKSKNARLQNDLDHTKDSNVRLREANTTAGVSFKTLNEHIKHLSKTNEKVTAELNGCRQQVQRLNLTQMELKDELQLKQATYAAEVQSRLQYQKLVTSIVDTVQERCRDTKLVEDILRSADAWEEQSQHTLNSVSP